MAWGGGGSTSLKLSTKLNLLDFGVPRPQVRQLPRIPDLVLFSFRSKPKMASEVPTPTPSSHLPLSPSALGNPTAPGLSGFAAGLRGKRGAGVLLYFSPW